MTQDPAPAPSTTLRAVPAAIWALGLGSLFMDASSELVHSLLPVFMVSVLGASMVTIGVVEGIAEATASITKIFSGAISDYFGKRKLLVVLGYGLGAVTKPMFPLASSVTWVFLGRFVDRIGKGIRGAPRDALVADITPPALRGTAYGLRQALDSVGAFVGPLLAVVLMQWFANDIRTVLWFGVVPAVIAVALLIVFVREPERHDSEAKARTRLTLATVKQLPRRYWLIVQLGAVFTLARFSEAFLVLRAQNLGLAIGYIPAVMIAMNVVYAGVAYPAGVAADRFGHRTLLTVGLAMLVLADLVLAGATAPAHAFLGTALLGVAHGSHPGPAVETRRRHRTCDTARHRVRCLQRRQRSRAAAGEHHCRRIVERRRSIRDVPCGSRVRIACDGRSRCGGTEQRESQMTLWRRWLQRRQ